MEQVRSFSSIHAAYPIGMVVSTCRGFLGVKAGDFGVVYEHHSLGGRESVNIIFRNDKVNGFSVVGTEILDLLPVRVEYSLRDYSYKDHKRLTNDFNDGLFESAFQLSRE